MASTEAYNDRHCIASLSRQPSGSGTGAMATMRHLFGAATTAKPDVTEFSAEDTLACCKGFSCGLSMGCNGGQPRCVLLGCLRLHLLYSHIHMCMCH
jgi:hypothetical protein